MTSPEDDDLTAGEYVLGTLDGPERTDAEARRGSDPAFEAAVTAWERRLVPLSEATADGNPSPQLWERILARIDALTGASATIVPFGRRIVHLERQVTRWRVVTAVTSAMAAALALWIAVGPRTAPAANGTQLVAFLQKSADEPAYVMGVGLRDDSISIRPIAASAPQGKAYELWVIDKQIGAPRSLGVLDAAVTTHRVPADVPPDVLTRATYAVTLEAPGGSPTGAPTSAPVFVGHLVQVPR